MRGGRRGKRGKKGAGRKRGIFEKMRGKNE